jgi:ketosteroid isomerase-like protein
MASSSNNLEAPRPTLTRTVSHNIRTAEDILTRFYAAERRYMASPAEKRDFADLEETLSPGVLVHQSPDMPYGGEYQGHDGFLKWSEAMATCFDRMEVSERQVLHNGNEVVVTSTLRMRVRKSGEEVLGPLIQWIKVDRDAGTIKEIRPFYWNVRGINEALGRGMYGC